MNLKLQCVKKIFTLHATCVTVFACSRVRACGSGSFYGPSVAIRDGEGNEDADSDKSAVACA